MPEQEVQSQNNIHPRLRSRALTSYYSSVTGNCESHHNTKIDRDYMADYPVKTGVQPVSQLWCFVHIPRKQQAVGINHTANSCGSYTEWPAANIRLLEHAAAFHRATLPPSRSVF